MRCWSLLNNTHTETSTMRWSTSTLSWLIPGRRNVFLGIGSHPHQLPRRPRPFTDSSKIIWSSSTPASLGSSHLYMWHKATRLMQPKRCQLSTAILKNECSSRATSSCGRRPGYIWINDWVTSKQCAEGHPARSRYRQTGHRKSWSRACLSVRVRTQRAPERARSTRECPWQY